MNKYGLVIGALLLPSISLANVNVGEFKGTLPDVTKDRCNDPKYYAAYRAETDTAINSTFDRRLNEIHSDNHANMATIVDEAMINLEGFRQAQSETCANFQDICSGADAGSNSTRRFDAAMENCLQETEERFAIAMGITRTAVMMNANRKARTTVEEKFKAIGHRYKTITLTILDDLRKEMQNLSSKASFLIDQTREVPGSQVQDA